MNMISNIVHKMNMLKNFVEGVKEGFTEGVNISLDEQLEKIYQEVSNINFSLRIQRVLESTGDLYHSGHHNQALARIALKSVDKQLELLKQKKDLLETLVKIEDFKARTNK